MQSIGADVRACLLRRSLMSLLERGSPQNRTPNQSLWFDLARTGQVKLAAALGLEGLSISQVEPASGGIPTSCVSVSAQRSDEIEAEKQKQHPSELPGEFWRELRIARGLPVQLLARLPGHAN